MSEFLWLLDFFARKWAIDLNPLKQKIPRYICVTILVTTQLSITLWANSNCHCPRIANIIKHVLELIFKQMASSVPAIVNTISLQNNHEVFPCYS